LNLGGVMVWSLDQDDYSGLFCRQGLFPFTKRVRHILLSTNENGEQDISSSTKATKLRTKNKISFVPIHRLTSQHQKSTLTSTQSSPSLSSKAKTVNGSVKNISILYLLFIVLFLIC